MSSAHSPTFRHFTYVTAHSPTLPSLCLRHSSVSNRSVASPTSQFVLQPFFRFSYVTGSSLTLPGELPMIHNIIDDFFYSWALLILQHSVTSPTSQLILQHFRRFAYVTAHSPTVPLLHLRHSSFSNPSFASPTSQAPHLRHLVIRPCYEYGSILLCARTRKVFTTLTIGLPEVAFKETNSGSPHYSLQIFSREDSLNSPNRQS